MTASGDSLFLPGAPCARLFAIMHLSKRLILVCMVAASLRLPVPAADRDAGILQELLALERRAMDGWLKGDPGPSLAISDEGITYFHAVTSGRLEGLPAVAKLYEPYRGTPLFDGYDISDAKVQAGGDVAVLTYHFARRNGATTTHWNATQVYQHKAEGWKVIHTHWSITNALRQP